MSLTFYCSSQFWCFNVDNVIVWRQNYQWFKHSGDVYNFFYHFLFFSSFQELFHLLIRSLWMPFHVQKSFRATSQSQFPPKLSAYKLMLKEIQFRFPTIRWAVSNFHEYRTAGYVWEEIWSVSDFCDEFNLPLDKDDDIECVYRAYK